MDPSFCSDTIMIPSQLRSLKGVAPVSNWKYRQFLQNNGTQIMQYNSRNAQAQSNIPECNEGGGTLQFNGVLGAQYKKEFSLKRRLISPNVDISKITPSK